MIKAIQKKLKNRKGFTLVELIIVIAIIGIIAAIAVPNFMKTRNNAQTKADDRSIDVVNKAAQVYMIENNKKSLSESTVSDLIDELEDNGYLDDDFKFQAITASDLKFKTEAVVDDPDTTEVESGTIKVGVERK